MKTDIQTLNFEAGRGLINQVHKKLKEFKKYYHNIIGADVYLKGTNRAEENANKTVEIRLFLPGADIYAAADAENFSIALGRVADKISRQLKKRNHIEKEKR